jgi:hypothetical protein
MNSDKRMVVVLQNQLVDSKIQKKYLGKCLVDRFEDIIGQISIGQSLPHLRQEMDSPLSPDGGKSRQR